MHLNIKKGYDKKIPFANYALNFFYGIQTQVCYLFCIYETKINQRRKEKIESIAYLSIFGKMLKYIYIGKSSKQYLFFLSKI